MAKSIRTIKREILEDHKSAGLSDAAWRLWVSSWLLADDFGNFRASPRWLESQIWWAAPERVRAEDLLEELSAAGLLILYAQDGQQYASVTNWSKHQRVDNAASSTIPKPNDSTVRRFAVIRGDSPQFAAGKEGKGEEGRGMERTLAQPSASREFDFDEVYRLYPRKQGKADGIRACKRKIKTAEQVANLIKAVNNFSESRKGQDPQYTPYFSTWINGQWEDWIDPPRNGAIVKQSQWLIDSAPMPAQAEGSTGKL